MSRLVTASLFLIACSKDEPPPNPPPEPQPSQPAPPAQDQAPSPAAEARTTFDTLCSVCHGKTGQGDGPGAASLDPKPRNYTDKAWQASVTDEEIRKIILEGGAAVGKSQLMPPNPQFKDKPAVVDELVKIVRGFAR